jgi:hypothetical protein
MGFLDKAKKMAEQAQSKLDEVQKQFNEGQSGSTGSQAPPVEYDQHGRPIGREPAAADPAGPPPAAEPAGPPPAAEPAGPPPAESSAPAPAEPVGPPPAGATPPHGDPLAAHEPAPPPPAPADPAPDPAAPQPREDDQYAPPKLSKGDPLAG